MSNPNQICFFPEPGDTNSFGSSVAINDKYLAIGDPNANYVIIYTRNNFGQWFRSKKIFPPKDSTPYKIGRGFGFDLQLDGDVLVINAYTQQRTREVTNPEYFQEITILTSSFYGRYFTRLDAETEVQAIDLPIEKKTGFVQFNLLSEGKIKQITLPDRGEERFGESVSLNNNLLLVGSPSYYDEGGAWLFDLNDLESKPLKINVSNIATGSTVAVSEQFVAIGNHDYMDQIPQGLPIPRKTIIRAINSGSTTVLNEVGHLVIDGKILAIFLAADTFWERYFPLLKVFHLDENAKPHLIMERGDADWVWLQNGFLAFVRRDENFNNPRVCIETIP